jgi:hypothetical protein
MSNVLATAELTGVFPAGNGNVELDLSGLLDEATGGDTTTYVFLVVDSQSRVAVSSGSLRALDYESQASSPGNAGDDQTATLLIGPGAAALGSTTLYLAFGNSSDVAYRGAAVVVEGELRTATSVRYATETVYGGLAKHQGAVAFFAHSEASLDIPVSATPALRFTESANGTPNTVEVYRWVAADAVTGASGGPWFHAQLVAYYKPPDYQVRPPVTDADTFWAPKACCDCADVFLINDDRLAEGWDKEGSTAFISWETLLLNWTDEDGTRWSMTDIEGWWNLPPVEAADLARPGYLDGSYPVDGRYGARIFTVSGVAMVGPEVSIAVPRQRLLRSLDAVRGGALFVAKEPVWAKQAWVYLEDQPKIDVRTKGMMEFEFTLKAPDPIKYLAGSEGVTALRLVDVGKNYLERDYSAEDDGSGVYTEESTLRGMRFREDLSDTPGPVPTDGSDPPWPAPNPYRRYQDEVEPASATALNAGTATVYPKIYVYGPTGNFVITNVTTGQRMLFQGGLQANETLIIDCYWRTVIRHYGYVPPSGNPLLHEEGENYRWMLHFSSEWIGLVPGYNTLSMEGVIGSPETQAYVVFRSGWMG